MDLPSIPEALKDSITEDDVNELLPMLIKRAKISLLYKKAREMLPDDSTWKDTPPIIKKLDNLSVMFNEEQDDNKNEVYNRVKFTKQVKAFLESVVKSLQPQLPDPGITRENVAKYKPTPYYQK